MHMYFEVNFVSLRAYCKTINWQYINNIDSSDAKWANFSSINNGIINKFVPVVFTSKK